MRNDFTCHTQKEHSKSISDYLPNGPIFEAKNIEKTTLKKLLLGLASEFVRDESSIKELSRQHDIRNTTDLISEWESMVGIPDDCFTGKEPLEERRRNVIIKLGIALLTEQDYIDLGLLLGVQVVIKHLPECITFPLPFPLPFCTRTPFARFTMIIQLPTIINDCLFPIPFPLCFASGPKTLIECLFRKFSPANVVLIFEYVL